MLSNKKKRKLFSPRNAFLLAQVVRVTPTDRIRVSASGRIGKRSCGRSRRNACPVYSRWCTCCSLFLTCPFVCFSFGRSAGNSVCPRATRVRTCTWQQDGEIFPVSIMIRKREESNNVDACVVRDEEMTKLTSTTVWKSMASPLLFHRRDRYLRHVETSFDVSSPWNVSRYWHVLWRANYSLLFANWINGIP